MMYINMNKNYDINVKVIFLQVERKFFGNGVPTCTGNIDSSFIIVSTHSISKVI